MLLCLHHSAPTRRSSCPAATPPTQPPSPQGARHVPPVSPPPGQDPHPTQGPVRAEVIGAGFRESYRDRHPRRVLHLTVVLFSPTIRATRQAHRHPARRAAAAVRGTAPARNAAAPAPDPAPARTPPE